MAAIAEANVLKSVDGDVRVIVYPARPGDRYLASRTIRALRQAGIDAIDAVDHMPVALAELLLSADRSIWLVRAGAWPVNPLVCFPPASSTGSPLVALGRIRARADQMDNEDVAAWTTHLAQCGGDLNAVVAAAKLPCASVFLERDLARRVGERLLCGDSMDFAIWKIARDGGTRVVRFTPLDVYDDCRLRVVQAVTSFQRGGAERIAMDLADGLPRFGMATMLVGLGPPSREPFATPDGAIELPGSGLNRSARIEKLITLARGFAADVVHAHLLSRDDLRMLSAARFPTVVTIHNDRRGWPEGFESIAPADAQLLIACAQAVEADVQSVALPVCCRTVWNGIDPGRFAPSDRRTASAAALRTQFNLSDNDFVIAALANPRPQKRMHRLPEILSVVQARLAQSRDPRRARLVIAGETSFGSAEARAAKDAVVDAAEKFAVEADVVWAGAIDDVPAFLAAGDVLASPSAYEGLSLAHLESLAAGLPVVATDVGGAAEIARDHPAMRLLKEDATADEFAAAILGASRSPHPLAAGFTQFRMLERHAFLYPRVIEAARPKRQGRGVWLLANNFSTGGAQTSARRLLLELAERGVPVRAAVIEEYAEHPTPGRQKLAAAGIQVVVLPHPELAEPAIAIRALLEHIDADPPEAVLLWNVIPQHKCLLVDALFDVPIYDVSPGEMFYSSMRRYFEQPRPGLPYRSLSDYGKRLAGVVVKYRGELRAAADLGAPVHVIYNGVSVQPLIRRPNVPGGKLVIGTTARLSPQKKLDELLAAVEYAKDRLPPFVVRIAGGSDGRDPEYIEALYRAADGLPVEWIGETDDVGAFLSELDVFVSISEPAGCPNAILEAMAAGLPIVATDVGGAAELVNDRQTGIIVPKQEPSALADAIVGLAADSGLRQRWGAAAHARAVERFSIDRMADEYSRLLFAGGDNAGDL